MKAIASSVRLSVLSAMLVLVGCPGSDIVNPPPPPVGSGEVVVKVNADKLSLRVNETAQLTVTVEKDGEQLQPGTVTYATSDSAVASVDPNTGLVTARGTGSTTLTVTAQGKSVTLTLKVEGGAVHAGEISASETWRAKDNPHFVLDDVQVEGTNHPTLTLEPGVIVRFAAKEGLIIGRHAPGSLKAEGTDAAPIQLVADTSTPTKGFWMALTFGEQSGTDSVLRHAKLSHCGSEYSAVPSTNPCIALMGVGTRPLMIDVSIQNSGGSGLEVEEGAAFASGSSNVSVSDANGYPIVIEPNAAATLPTGGALANNTPNAVRLFQGDVTASQTWPILKDGTGANVPYVADGVVVSGPSSPMLTLRAGTEVRFKHNGYLQVGSTGGPGGLIAEGTAATPIRFVADSTAPGKGFWSSLYFQESRLSTTKLNHVLVDRSGGSNHIAGSNAAITIVGDVNGAFIQNTRISNSGECGIRTEATDSYPVFATDLSTGMGNIFEDNNGAAHCPQ